MEKDYTAIIEERAQKVFDIMAKRTTPEEVARIRAAFELAREAHAPQKRKTGEPYILHPIAVATIAAEELMLDSHPVMAAFLHDVVEDTPYTIEDIEERYVFFLCVKSVGNCSPIDKSWLNGLHAYAWGC